jgi:hypothetical protein
MPIPWDADILIFLWTTVKTVFTSKQRLRAAKRAIPVHEELEEVPEDTLTQAQKDYVRPYDSQLAALNYFPTLNHRVTNYKNLGRHLVRCYSNPADTASCKLTIVEVKVKVGDVESVKTSSNVNFRTRFSNGKSLTTRNMSLKSLMDRPPYSIMQECRHTTSLTELKRLHDKRVAQLGAPLAPPSRKDAIFEEHHKEHQRFSEYQVQRGIYRLTPDGQMYEMTDKVHARGIWNHYNPFARRIALAPTLLSALVGCVLPLYAILRIAPHITEQLGGGVPGLFAASSLVIALSYVLAGAIIGAVSDRASFHWIMLISYLPAHIVAGWSFGWLPYSTVMFLTSFYVIRAKRRSALIFES